MPKKFQIERVHDEEGLLRLREEWDALLAKVPATPVNLTWEWAYTWARYREPSWELWILTARDADGRLAGIAPWMMAHHYYGPLQVRRLAFIGSYLTYRAHMDLIAAPAEKEAVFRDMMEHLTSRRRQWDVLDLESLADGSPLGDCLAQAGLRYLQLASDVCPYMPLPDTWEAYERAQLSSNHRWELRNRRRKLERDHPGQVVFRRVGNQGELAPAMDALTGLHQKRWHGKGQGSSFDHPSFAGFQREMAELALARNWLRLYLLEVDGQAIAAEYAFLLDGRLMGYTTAFDQDWRDYSPGQLIMAHAIQDAIAEGVRELDLGRGSFDYKFRFAGQERHDRHVQASAGLAGDLWLAAGAAYRGAKTLAREKLPPSIRDRVNRWLPG